MMSRKIGLWNAFISVLFANGKVWIHSRFQRHYLLFGRLGYLQELTTLVFEKGLS